MKSIIIFRINPVALKQEKPVISDTSIYIKTQIKGKKQIIQNLFLKIT